MSVYRKNAINSLSVNQINPYAHLIKRIRLLKGFSKTHVIQLRIFVVYAIFITRMQYHRAKLYLACPSILLLKNNLKRIVIKKTKNDLINSNS